MKRNQINLALSLFIASALVFTGCSNTTTATSANPGETPAVVTPVEPEKLPEPELPKVDESIIYINAAKLKVREAALEESNVIGDILKGKQAKIVEESKDEAGKEWLKISFSKDEKEFVGWVLKEGTVKDRVELLRENLKNLDYSPQMKIEYPNNPRVEVKGIYLTIYSAGGARLDKLIEMSKRTKINTFVIDVKDDNGHMLFKTKAAEKFSPEANNHTTVKDIQVLMQKLKENNIYTIARIVSFKDPTYAVLHPDKAIINTTTGKPFTNSDGLVWTSPHDRQLWEYNIEVSKEAIQAGFNEVQFDYVRFPASNGGKLDKTLDYRNPNGENKPETIQNYLKYAKEALSPMQAYISADIYGLVGSVEDDMSLGQYWEAVSNIVDYVSPMMYPSHYANGTYGLKVPDAFPYETLDQGSKDAIERNKNIVTPAIIRPWIQDFTAPWVKGHIKYGDKQLEDQIKALEKNGVNQYLIWNAGNTYHENAVLK